MSMTAADVVRLLGLTPHPEGGYYRETFRYETLNGAGRAASTAIYFLLAEGQRSHWHRVDAAEVWHWYAGAAIALGIAPCAGTDGSSRSPAPVEIVLGPDLASGARPQVVVPAGHWQQARSLGSWTLVGCTVAPGFSFKGFDIAAPRFEPGSD